MCTSLRQVFLSFFIRLYGAYSTYYCVRDGFYTVFEVVPIEVDVLLSVGGFVVDICDDSAIYVFYEDV